MKKFAAMLVVALVATSAHGAGRGEPDNQGQPGAAGVARVRAGIIPSSRFLDGAVIGTTCARLMSNVWLTNKEGASQNGAMATGLTMLFVSGLYVVKAQNQGLLEALQSTEFGQYLIGGVVGTLASIKLMPAALSDDAKAKADREQELKINKIVDSRLDARLKALNLPVITPVVEPRSRLGH